MGYRKEEHDPARQGNGFAYRFGGALRNVGVFARHHRDLARSGGSTGKPLLAVRQKTGLPVPTIHRGGHRTPPGGVYGPYTGTCFASTRQTDIEHIVATSEAHDSGLCARDRAVRARFAADLRNLTLAAPRVNRHQKSGKDAAEWLPDRNRCWFAARVVEVRRAYDLTIDPREAVALDRILAQCDSTDMEPMACTAEPASVGDRSEESGDSHALARYDSNGNGRITCDEARYHGIAPVPRGHPAYRYMRDGDRDGVVCE